MNFVLDFLILGRFFLNFWTLFSFSILTYIPNFFKSINVCRIQSKYKCASFSCSNSQEVKKILKFFVYCKFSTKNFKKNTNFVTEVLKHLKKQKISCNSFIFLFLGGSRIIQWHYFHSPLCHALYQPTYQISKESIHVCRIQSQYKCASFSCSTTSWWPFWISNFSQTSYIWHT